MSRFQHNRIKPAQVVILGFLIQILVGACLLTLPVSTQSGEGASFLDALFTATSATCVTGLVVQDTAQFWSPFGQGVILLLIQIGGMGVVTMAVAISIFSGRKIGLRERWVMQESISAPQVGGIVRMTGFILKLWPSRPSAPWCWPCGSARSSVWARGSGMESSTPSLPSATRALI